MKTSSRLPALFSILLVSAGSFALSQTTADGWGKNYTVSAKPSLTIGVSDAAVEVRSCGDCRQVRVNVVLNGRKLSDYTLNEFQSGDHVNFELKDKAHLLRFNVGHQLEPRVTVETPATVDLELRTSDGAIEVSGVQGTIAIHTSDGAVDVHDVAGAVRLTASDGSIHIRNVTGTLESRSSDGRVTIDGKFSALQVHSSDGEVEMNLADGTQLNAASRIESSDGRVTIRLPKALNADVEVHTSDGKIDCDLPLMVEGYNSASNSGHSLRGKLNAGGPSLIIHTSDGNVAIRAI